jgi:hypothetical protein
MCTVQIVFTKVNTYNLITKIQEIRKKLLLFVILHLLRNP